MVRHRARIRFSKLGELRYVGHRDLIRTWERIFRRAALPLRMSEGFHPKPKMTIASPLPVGVSGDDEVMEVELSEAPPVEDLSAAVSRCMPPGLKLKSVEYVPEGSSKPRPCRGRWSITIDEARRSELQQTIERFRTSTADQRHAWTYDRGDGKAALCLHDFVEDLQLDDAGVLHITLLESAQRSIRPRDVLEVLALGDLEENGSYLTRTRLELQ